MADIFYQPSRLKLVLGPDGVGQAVMNEGDLNYLGVKVGTKIAGAKYSNPIKSDANLTSVFGVARATSDPKIIVGSSSSYVAGASLSSSGYLKSLKLTINKDALSLRTSVLGTYHLSNQYDATSDKYYITLSHDGGKSQQLEVHDVPVIAGSIDEYNFNELGVTLSYSVNFGRGADGSSAPSSLSTPGDDAARQLSSDPTPVPGVYQTEIPAGYYFTLNPPGENSLILVEQGIYPWPPSGQNAYITRGFGRNSIVSLKFTVPSSFTPALNTSHGGHIEVAEMPGFQVPFMVASLSRSAFDFSSAAIMLSTEDNLGQGGFNWSINQPDKNAPPYAQFNFNSGETWYFNLKWGATQLNDAHPYGDIIMIFASPNRY